MRRRKVKKDSKSTNTTVVDIEVNEYSEVNQFMV